MKNLKSNLILFVFVLAILLHYLTLTAGAAFGLYFLYLLADASYYYFAGFLCLCYLCITSYFYAFDA
ncbi:hypothetical protein [Spirosoma areae]